MVGKDSRVSGRHRFASLRFLRPGAIERVNREDVNRPGNVLEGPIAEIGECYGNFAFDLIERGPREAYSARRSNSFEPLC